MIRTKDPRLRRLEPRPKIQSRYTSRDCSYGIIIYRHRYATGEHVRLEGFAETLHKFINDVDYEAHRVTYDAPGEWPTRRSSTSLNVWRDKRVFV